MKRTAIKHRPTRQERTTPPEVKREVCLRAGGKWNPEAKICTGGTCEICHGKKMDGRGLKFMHKIRRKMGGTTSKEVHSAKNVFRACYVCDDENDGERLPRSGPVDKIPMLSGSHGPTGCMVPKEMQTGDKSGKITLL